MWTRTLAAIGIGLALLSAASVAQAVKPEENQATREKGKKIYDRACLLCHGVDRKGDGPDGWFIGRYESPRPRNFIGGSYKFRSTPSGELPMDQDLFRTVTQGIPGHMPPYGGLSEEERWQVIALSNRSTVRSGAQTPRPWSCPILLALPLMLELKMGAKHISSMDARTATGITVMETGRKRSTVT
jgi:mono/diheme cytochrome c family protein